PPPTLRVEQLGDRTDGEPLGGEVIVVGAGGTPGGAAATLELRLGASGSVAIPPPSRVADAGKSGRMGWVQTVDLPGRGVHVLWVGGVDSRSVTLAGQALYDRGLAGRSAVVLPAGRTGP